MNAEIKTSDEQRAEASAQIPSGMQAAIRSVVKMLGLDPVKIEGQIRDFAGIMLNIDGRLNTLQAENAELKSKISEILSLLKKEKSDA